MYKTGFAFGKDISHQHTKSKYCSEKFVGYAEAHKCRNDNSNPRNNFKREIDDMRRKDLLFDIMPYSIKEPA